MGEQVAGNGARRRKRRSFTPEFKQYQRAQAVDNLLSEVARTSEALRQQEAAAPPSRRHMPALVIFSHENRLRRAGGNRQHSDFSAPPWPVSRLPPAAFRASSRTEHAQGSCRFAALAVTRGGTVHDTSSGEAFGGRFRYDGSWTLRGTSSPSSGPRSPTGRHTLE
jgi:hypothetical protein